MTCERARDLLAGEPLWGEKGALDGHVAACRSCQEEAEGIAALRSDLGALRGDSVPAPVYSAVRAGVLREIAARTAQAIPGVGGFRRSDAQRPSPRGRLSS